MKYLYQVFLFLASPAILEITRQIVLWLIAQRNDAGAFVSTQDTVIGLQALATYQIWVNEYVSSCCLMLEVEKLAALRCIYTRCEAKSKGWQSSRMVVYVTYSK